METPKVLIVDAGKASLVMTSEIVKNKLPGSVVYVAQNGKETLQMMAEKQPNLVIIDFDLPDTDGVTLILTLRKYTRVPLLLTAYPDNIVEAAVSSDLFVYNDSYSWLKKPMQFDELAAALDRFLIEHERIEKRFPVQIKSMLIGKGAGRGKRAPKASGKLLNASVGGACLETNTEVQFRPGDELSLTLALPALTKSSKPSHNDKNDLENSEQKVKVKVAWVNGGKIGMEFNKLTDLQKRGFEQIFRRMLVKTDIS